MKKRVLFSFLSGLLCFSMLFTLSGCNSGNGGETETDTETDTESETKAKDTATETEELHDELEYYTSEPLENLKAGESTTSAKLVSRTYKLKNIDSKLRYIGRTKLLLGGLLCDHSASGFEVQGFMTGELKMTASSFGDTYYTVFIDGKRVDKRFHSNKANVTMTIANFEGNYFHTVKVLKQSESAWSTSVIGQLQLNGVLFDAPKERELLFEVLGDSLTTGYGNLGVKGEGNAQGGNTPLKQDATQSYGFLAAEAFNADCNILAWSGVGLDIGWTHAPYTDYYNKFSFHRSDEKNKFGRAPDLLIIHLGANDSTNKDTSKEAFIEKGINLINTIRTGYAKEMPVIWAYDPNEGVPEYVQEILDHFGGEEKGFYILELEWQSTNENWGASGHPSVKAHEKHAKILVDFINSKNILA